MHSIKAKLTMAIALLIFISVSILGTVSYWNARKAIVHEAETSLNAMVNDNARIMGMWLSERRSELTFLAHSPSVSEIASEEALSYLRAESKRSAYFSSFMMADSKGVASFTTANLPWGNRRQVKLIGFSSLLNGLASLATKAFIACQQPD